MAVFLFPQSGHKNLCLAIVVSKPFAKTKSTSVDSNSDMRHSSNPRYYLNMVTKLDL